MTDEENGKDIARLGNEAKNQDRRITNLEGNQRWGVMAILGLAAKAAFDFFAKGPQ